MSHDCGSCPGAKAVGASGLTPKKYQSAEKDVTGGTMTMRRPGVAMASFVVVLLVLPIGHRWSVTALLGSRAIRHVVSDMQRHGLQHALVWIATACSARGCGSFMTKANLAAYVGGGALLNT